MLAIIFLAQEVIGTEVYKVYRDGVTTVTYSGTPQSVQYLENRLAPHNVYLPSNYRQFFAYRALDLEDEGTFNFIKLFIE